MSAYEDIYSETIYDCVVYMLFAWYTMKFGKYYYLKGQPVVFWNDW
jgi:hypothetical protein